jgi:hypothetical protein
MTCRCGTSSKSSARKRLGRGGGETWRGCLVEEGDMGRDAQEGHGQPPGSRRGPHRVPGGHVRAAMFLSRRGNPEAQSRGSTGTRRMTQPRHRHRGRPMRWTWQRALSKVVVVLSVFLVEKGCKGPFPKLLEQITA